MNGKCSHIVFGQRCYKCGRRVAKSHDLTRDELMSECGKQEDSILYKIKQKD